VVEAGRLGLKKSGRVLPEGRQRRSRGPAAHREAPAPRATEEEIQMGLLTAMVQVGKDILDREDRRRRPDDRRGSLGLGFPADKADR